MIFVGCDSNKQLREALKCKYEFDLHYKYGLVMYTLFSKNNSVVF